jgi:plastocyanin
MPLLSTVAGGCDTRLDGYTRSNHRRRACVASHMNRIVATLACAALALAVFAAPVSGAGKHVTIKSTLYSYKFSPKTVTIAKGKTVHWAWNSDAKHNVKFGDKLDGKHSKTAFKVDDFHVTFNKTGTFKYRCTVHGFTGKVVVEQP